MFHFHFHLQATGIKLNIAIGGDGGDDLDNTPNIRERSTPHNYLTFISITGQKTGGSAVRIVRSFHG